MTTPERVSGRFIQEIIKTEGNHCENPTELSGLKRAIQRTALRRFILHCEMEISQMLRARDINDLNDAFAIDVEEDKILNNTTHPRPVQLNSYCNFSKMNGHTTQNCRKRQLKLRGDLPPRNNSFQEPPARHSSYEGNKFCNYCNPQGHEIRERRKDNTENNIEKHPEINHPITHIDVLPIKK